VKDSKEKYDLEANKHNSARILQEISDQIATMRKTLDQYQLSCKEERLELTKIQLQKVRLQGLVDNFQNKTTMKDMLKSEILLKKKCIVFYQTRKCC
jgi:competence protein ComGF